MFGHSNLLHFQFRLHVQLLSPHYLFERWMWAQKSMLEKSVSCPYWSSAWGFFTTNPRPVHGVRCTWWHILTNFCSPFMNRWKSPLSDPAWPLANLFIVMFQFVSEKFLHVNGVRRSAKLSQNLSPDRAMLRGRLAAEDKHNALGCMLVDDVFILSEHICSSCNMPWLSCNMIWKDLFTELVLKVQKLWANLSVILFPTNNFENFIILVTDLPNLCRSKPKMIS